MSGDAVLANGLQEVQKNVRLAICAGDVDDDVDVEGVDGAYELG
jgi:hypothetical protein